jgi:signal transduction histidine kinase
LIDLASHLIAHIIKKEPSMSDAYHEFLFRLASKLRKDLLFAQTKIREISSMEDIEEFFDLTNSPIDHAAISVATVADEVNNLYDYALAATNRMEINLEEIDISAMLDGVLTIADQLTENGFGLTLEEQIDQNLPTIQADAERLSQALLQYIHNATKFTENGTITLRVRKEPNNILFEVSDTGIGIPEEKQELVFEAFETILEDKNDSRLGLGIGLKTAEHIINLHNGETWFESKAGSGSSFYFTIPL